MILYLVVPYSEKDEAKKLGCRWDKKKKQWYVIDPENIFDFVKWAPERLKKQTTSGPLQHPPFVVTQPRTPRKKHWGRK